MAIKLPINEFTLEELELEIKQRKYDATRAARPEMHMPVAIFKIRYTCQEYIDSIIDDAPLAVSDSCWEAITRASLEAVYGNEIWDWINEHE